MNQPALEVRLASAIQDLSNSVSGHLPDGHVVSLCIENGAAWVELFKAGVGAVPLPDSADKTILDQLNDAL